MINVTLQSGPYRRDYSQIMIDEDPYRELQSKYLKKFSLIGSYPDQESWEQLFEEWECKTIKAIILQKLNYKSYFTTEMTRFLEEAGFLKNRVEKTIDECQNLYLFKDEDQVKSLISKAISSGKGPYWIKQALRIKGMEGAEKWIETLYPREKRVEIIHHFLTKSKKKPQLAVAALQRRGFSFQEIMEARSIVF